ncbi:hypothetical protein [Pedobacter puniceum]|uniref:Uncharacterized protein n=1 Tax=Pedobacter puniceum TaxID=2666136 RepID=A0A7K0FMT9_9SPHI|nr:hypothetical protein [Pedobacter puniceum]MRX47278.1 hypothetical protein [Pedobacter puniceum]
MKRKKNIKIAFAIFICIFFCNCKKDIIFNTSTSQPETYNVEALKLVFANSGYQSQLLLNHKDSIEISWKPDWKKFQKKLVNDSLAYYYIPLDLQILNKKTNVYLKSPISNTDKYILFKETSSGLDIKLATYIIPPKSNITAIKDESKDLIQDHTTDFKNFNGVLLLKDFKNKTINSYEYRNGVHKPLKNQISRGSKQASTSERVECTLAFVDCLWYGQHHGGC